VRFRLGELRFPVALDPLFLGMPAVDQLAHRAPDQMRKIAGQEARVLAGDPDLPGEGQVVTNEALAADHEAGGEGLVVAVA
jgi:hypothetical protein